MLEYSMYKTFAHKYLFHECLSILRKYKKNKLFTVKFKLKNGKGERTNILP